MSSNAEAIVRKAMRRTQFFPGTFHEIADELSKKYGVSKQRCTNYLTAAFNRGELKRVVEDKLNPSIAAGYEPRRVWVKRQKAEKRSAQLKVKNLQQRRRSKPVAPAERLAEAA